MPLLAWWYRFTAPPEVPASASLVERERVRRGQLSSAILFVMLVFLLASLIGALFQGNYHLVYVLLPSFIVSIVVLVLNRFGTVLTAGIVLVLGFELGYLISIVKTSGGLSVSDLPRFDLLVEPVLLAVSFLPARSVPWIAAGNCLFIWLSITFLPHTPDMRVLFANQSYTIIEQPIALQVIVAFVTYLWVRSTNLAIERADRAEDIAALQQTIARQKAQLDEGIQQILNTHVQVANGNIEARAPLSQDNALWQVASSLNNLLTRFQRTLGNEREFQRTRYELMKTQEALAQSRQETARLMEMMRRNRGTETPQSHIASRVPQAFPTTPSDGNMKHTPRPSSSFMERSTPTKNEQENGQEASHQRPTHGS
jgi:hypothetical protein